MDTDELGAGLASYLEDNDESGPYLAAVDFLYLNEFYERAADVRSARAAYLADTDDPALFAAAVDETLFYSDEALKRADEALERVAEAARQRVVRRRQREFKLAVMRLGRHGHTSARVRVIVPTRSSRRESHRLRAGHKRVTVRSSAKSGDSGDDGPAEPAPSGFARCPRCGGVLLLASGVDVCANRRCSRYGEAS